ncbi:aldehyde dehydrogenase (NADP(+)) [Nocardia sp. NEAU-G5]|uniref:Aldehyde dehydrogenase (NADP(+)) n=1 Tax=Nocardia albiluteola TaxID=2842303 RepID=A0ABS6AW51_9NOCA|nr:aldehyde dehydrogenase (NADP(+)) [Nocardia albiluteola]MBU3061770.1 aldehyde dehydrogenase (NADP(+)) [Nocardia albiluteola]
MSAPVWSVDPRTGGRREPVTTEATSTDVDRAVRAAHGSRVALSDRTARARFLREAAQELERDRDRLVSVADAETALGAIRLAGEIGRTCGQLRAFAEIAAAGNYLAIIIDHADGTATPPRPDLRRYKIPLGVVAVYAASNFPFAFSVAGGDTASALAAGCPVVVKAHPDHPATSELTAAALARAAERTGLPSGVVQLVHGFEAGAELVRHPLVAAAGFTGSIRGGRALFDAAAARPAPIPFHGELGSVNPVVITAAAAAERAERIGTSLAASVTLGHGQFCVKPGLVLVPAGPDGDRLVASLARALAETAPNVLLDSRIRENFLRGAAERAGLAGAWAPVPAGADGEHAVRAGLLTVSADAIADHDVLLEECFGPITVVVRYESAEQLSGVLDRVPGSLTATVQLARDGDQQADELLTRMREFAGRIVVNEWPTGVAVTAAQHHGGPYPASTSTFTSVGATAIERWLRPVAFQNTPDALLPPELREANPLALPRWVDGRPCA